MNYSKNGTTYHVERMPNEPDDHLHIRGWFIAWCQPKTPAQYQTDVIHSYCYLNHKVMGSQYNKLLMEKFAAYERDRKTTSTLSGKTMHT